MSGRPVICSRVRLRAPESGALGCSRGGAAGTYGWSSYPAYRRPPLRRKWLRVDRLLGDYGLQDLTPASRREFARASSRRGSRPGEEGPLRQGWTVGAEDFCDWLADKLTRVGRAGERARERSETDAALAEGMVTDALEKLRWREINLALERKGHPAKVAIARELRSRTPMTRDWIATRLRMGSASYVSNLLQSVESKL
jgi:hypothetical protein